MRAAAGLLLAALLLAPPATVAAQASTHYLLLGSRVASFDHPPVIDAGGETYLSLALLDELGLRSADEGGAETGAATPAAPANATQGFADPLARRVALLLQSPDSGLPPEHYSPSDDDEQAPGEDEVGGQAVELAPLPQRPPAAPAAGRVRYRLAGHVLDVASGTPQPAAELDGTALPATALLRYGGHDYLSSARFAGIGLRLAYNAQQDLYQVVGLIQRVDSGPDTRELTLGCLTPVSVEGVQVDDNSVTAIVEGGFLADTATREYPGGSVITKLGFKTQPELGRSFLFIRQPRRTGFLVQADPRVGYARLRFGNYFQVASYQLSSSGDLSVTMQLGAPCTPQLQYLTDPPRLVVDFPGVVYEDATETIPVGQGSVTQIRIGRPVPGTVRVVLDLTEHVDHRLLSKDDGARYYLQLLPARPVAATSAAQLRRGRTVMIDPGHGGSDPGAPGVLPDAWEAPINLAICEYLEADLRQLGYEVLSTRKSDRFVSLGARADYANRVLPYVFVSVHSNSMEDPDYHGVMTFHHPASRYGPRLAALIQEEVLRSTGATDKRVRQANFFVLRETVMPSALVECGVLTNREECAKMVDPAYQQRIAQGIARGIDRYITGL